MTENGGRRRNIGGSRVCYLPLCLGLLCLPVLGDEPSLHAEIGKFLLIERIDGTRIALKLTEGTKPDKEESMCGARYDCFVFPKAGTERREYTGEVSQTDLLAATDDQEPSSNQVYIICDTFGLEWSAGHLIHFTDAISRMARSEWSRIEDVRFDDKSLEWTNYVPVWARGKGSAQAESARQFTKPASAPTVVWTNGGRVTETYEQGIPLMQIARALARSGGFVRRPVIRAELGKFVLIRRIDGLKAALKVTEHTRPNGKGYMFGAKYICYLFSPGGTEPKLFQGEVYEPDPAGRMGEDFLFDHIYIVCDSLGLQWSWGDSIYFTESIEAMAQSGWSRIEDVDFKDESLGWVSSVPPWKWERWTPTASKSKASPDVEEAYRLASTSVPVYSLGGTNEEEGSSASCMPGLPLNDAVGELPGVDWDSRDIYEVGILANTNRVTLKTENWPAALYCSWFAHFAGCGVVMNTNGKYRFVPEKEGDQALGNLWRNRGSEEARLGNLLDTRCLIWSGRNLSQFLEELPAWTHVSVIVDPSVERSRCWTNEIVVTNLPTTWRRALDTVLPKYGLKYTVQGGAVFVQPAQTDHRARDPDGI